MHKSHLLRDDDLYEYLLAASSRETDIQKMLRETTIAKTDQSKMMTTVEQAQFLQFLVKLINAKRAIEVGVFTGYASLAIASALPNDGVLIGCELNSQWPKIGEPFWKNAKVDHKIKLRIGDARESLEKLLEEGHENSFDFIFIDADKKNYSNYYNLALRLIRLGGLIAMDNCLLIGGETIDRRSTEITAAIYEFNQQVRQDSRVIISLVPIGSGIYLISKK